MAIRAWFLDGLSSSKWDGVTDRRVVAPGLSALLAFPDDYHLFIITIYQVNNFEMMLDRHPRLRIHYKQAKPSVSYRYPSEPAKLLTYILQVIK